MLHLFFKWRYDRQSRKSSFSLPPESTGHDSHNPNLSDYITRGSPQSPGFKHYDQPRRRKKATQIIATILGICILIWVAYESILAIATMGN